MKKFLLSILVLLNFAAVTAAQQQPAPTNPMQTLQCTDGELQKSTAICNRFITLKNMIEDSGLENENPIPVPFSKETVECLIALTEREIGYLNALTEMDQEENGGAFLKDSTLEQLILLVKTGEDPFLEDSIINTIGQPLLLIRAKEENRNTYLQNLSPEQLILLVKAADFLDIDQKRGFSTSTDLIEYALTTFTVEQLAQQIACFVDNDETMCSKISETLKRMQLAIISRFHVTERDLAHPNKLGAEKVALLKSSGLWPKISIQSLCNSKEKKYLLAFSANHLFLKDRHLNSLHGLDNILNVKNITALDLPNNKITRIDVDVFNGLFELRRLNLKRNSIETLIFGAFNGLSKLENLDLSNNQLKTIVLGSFDGLSQLQKLNLSNNKLKHVNATIFDCLRHLNFLDLSSNQLKIARCFSAKIFLTKLMVMLAFTTTIYSLEHILPVAIHRNGTFFRENDINDINRSDLANHGIRYFYGPSDGSTHYIAVHAIPIIFAILLYITNNNNDSPLVKAINQTVPKDCTVRL